MKFEYQGPGGECVYVPQRVLLEKKGQIVEVDDPAYEKELETRSDKFKPVGDSKKTKSKGDD